MVHGFNDITPSFGKVESIIVVAGEPILLLQCVQTAGYCEHNHCYVLNSDHSCQQAFLFTDLIDYYPLHSHSSFSQSDYNLYVCLKWNIENIRDNVLVD